MPSIRSLTLLISDLSLARRADRVVEEFRGAIKSLGLDVWTLRITFPQGFDWRGATNLCGDEVLISAFHTELGTLSVGELVDYLRSCGNFFASVATSKSISPEVLAEIYMKVSEELGEEAQTRLGFSLGGFIETPYYPLSTAFRTGFSVALRYVDLLEGKPLNLWGDLLRDYLTKLEGKLRELERLTELPFLGFDLSLSPWMEESVVTLIEGVSGHRFPGLGTPTAIAGINELLSKVGEDFRVLGFNEVMLPVGEDNKLKELARNQELKLADLIGLIPYSLAGLDMVAVHADKGLVSVLVGDVLTAAKIKKGKIVGVRLIVTSSPDEIRLERFGPIPVLRE